MSNRIVTDDNFVEQMQTANYWLAQIAAGSRKYVDNFKIVQADVQRGNGAFLYPVGTQLTLKHAFYGDIVFDVVAHDTVKKSGSPNAHTMTLLAHDCISTQNFQFDSPEAMYYAETELAAGTYNFTVGATYSKWEAGTYQFTLTQAVPAGGQICIGGNADTVLTDLYIRTYASQQTTTVLETTASKIASGSAGTSLGAWAKDLNSPQRMSWGSNNYKESALRQLLNSDAAAGSIWTPQTKFDRPPSWVSDSNYEGYLKGCPADFLDAIAPAVVKCSANNTYECPASMGGTVTKNTAYELTDKIFLASEWEVGLDGGDVADGSTLYEFFEGAENADRIKTLNGSAIYWWLRTAYTARASGSRNVNSNGGLNYNHAKNTYGLVPACIIA